MGNRKQTEELILKYIDEFVPGGANKKLYEDLFKSMNNKEFEEFMVKLRDNKITLSVIVPNGSDIKVSVENVIKTTKKLGYNFFQHLVVKNEKDLPPYKTPNKFLVVKLPIKRAAQLLSKKISIPKHNRSIDLTTGQVTGDSKASKLTAPEIQMLVGMGLSNSIKELMKYRGGDLGSLNAMNNLLYKQGHVNNDVLDQYSTGVVSTKTLDSYFKASHIKSTLVTNYKA
jgi:hypothetical protein